MQLACFDTCGLPSNHSDLGRLHGYPLGRELPRHAEDLGQSAKLRRIERVRLHIHGGGKADGGGWGGSVADGNKLRGEGEGSLGPLLAVLALGLLGVWLDVESELLGGGVGGADRDLRDVHCDLRGRGGEGEGREGRRGEEGAGRGEEWEERNGGGQEKERDERGEEWMGGVTSERRGEEGTVRRGE